MSRHKYRVKKPDGVKASSTEKVDLVCINCGHRTPMEITIITLPDGRKIRPNTGEKIVLGWLGPQPGTWLGCKLGSHDEYFEYELEENK